MKFFYGLMLCFLVLIAHGQSSQKHIDSLRLVLESAQGLDKVKSQYNLATLLVTINSDEAEKLATAALEVSRQQDFKEGVMNASIVKATLANVRSDFAESRKLLEEAIILANELNLEEGLSKAHTVLGSLYLRKGEYALATENHLKAFTAAEMLGEFDVQATNLMNVGLIKQRIGELEEAEEFLLNALAICIENDLQFRTGQMYINLGVLEFKRQNLGLSIDYNQKALDTFVNFGDRYQQAICLQNLGFAQASLGNYEQARAYYDQVEVIRTELDDQRGLAAVLLNMAKLAKTTGSVKEAQQLAESGLNKAVLVSNARMRLQINAFLFSLLEEQGQYQQALDYYKSYSILKDSMNALTNEARIAELSAEYEFEKQQQQLMLSQEQLRLSENRQRLLESERWILILVVIALIIIGTLFLVNYRTRVYKMRVEKKLFEEQRANSDLQQEKLRKDMELQALELRGFAEQIGHKNELISQFKRDLNVLRENANVTLDQDHLNDLATHIDGRSATISLEEFRLKFNEVHPDFVSGIISNQGYLTQNELDLCIFLKVNLTYKDIAQIQSISYDGIKKSMQRLYKKLNFSSVEELRAYILTM